jgi:hypothetical protein
VRLRHAGLAESRQTVLKDFHRLPHAVLVTDPLAKFRGPLAHRLISNQGAECPCQSTNAESGERDRPRTDPKAEQLPAPKELISNERNGE